MPYGSTFFEMEFDFIDHQLSIKCSDGALRTVQLSPKSVAKFYQEIMTALDELGMPVHIWRMPVEIPNPIPFDEDFQHQSYDPAYANKFWQILRHADRVMENFRSRFIGKCSPVHFFWGSFDLAVTRFSGRPAPPKPDADSITREAYSHEVISHGWCPATVLENRLSTPTPLPLHRAYPMRRFILKRLSGVTTSQSTSCYMTMFAQRLIRMVTSPSF
jgi:hypothetical protein